MASYDYALEVYETFRKHKGLVKNYMLGSINMKLGVVLLSITMFKIKLSFEDGMVVLGPIVLNKYINRGFRFWGFNDYKAYCDFCDYNNICDILCLFVQIIIEERYKIYKKRKGLS